MWERRNKARLQPEKAQEEAKETPEGRVTNSVQNLISQGGAVAPRQASLAGMHTAEQVRLPILCL